MKNKLLKVFILDDECHPAAYRWPIAAILSRHKPVIALNPKQGVELYTFDFDILLLDHDMEGFYGYDFEYENTGSWFARWLRDNVDKHSKLPEVILHSHNSDGRKNMRSILQPAGFPCQEIAFGLEYLGALEAQLG